MAGSDTLNWVVDDDLSCFGEGGDLGHQCADGRADIGGGRRFSAKVYVRMGIGKKALQHFEFGCYCGFADDSGIFFRVPFQSMHPHGFAEASAWRNCSDIPAYKNAFPDKEMYLARLRYGPVVYY